LYFSYFFNFKGMFSSKWEKTNFIILEMKYPQEKEKIVSKITQFFPFRLTRSSKYVYGAEKLLSF